MNATTETDPDILRRMIEIERDQAAEIQASLSNELDRLQAENKRLHERLKDNLVFELKDGQMVRVDVAPGSILDGIECRDQTIKLQDAEVDRLRAEVGKWKIQASESNAVVVKLWEHIDRLRDALADIAFSENMTLEIARNKARRIYCADPTKDAEG